MKKSTLLFIPAFLITGIALFYAWVDWSGARQLKQSLATLDAKKETLRIEDFLPTPVPDERNVAAAPIFKEFFASFRPLKNVSRISQLLERWGYPESELEGGESWIHFKARQIDPNFQGDESAAGEIILKYLAPSDPTLKEISEALQRPDVVWPLDYLAVPHVALPHLGLLIHTARIFNAKALAEMATGASEKAFGDTQNILAIARACKEPQSLTSEVAEINTLYLAAEVINQALNQGSWNDAQLTTISTELSEFRLLRQYLPALRLERAALFSTSTVDYLKDKSLEGRNGFSRGWPKSFKLALFHLRPRGWESEDKAVFLVIIQRMIDSLGDGEQLYSTEIWDEVQRKNNLHGWESTRTPITFLAIGAWDWTVKSICQTQTRLNALSAACAVERFKLANHQLPASLDDLVPSLLPFVPKDPMTGAPLIYKRVQGMAVSDGQHSARTAEALLGKGESKSTPPSTDDSFVIYGLGWNRKDDGGPKVSFNASPEYQSDWGVIVTPTK